MLHVRHATPRGYIYLDASGIEGLYAQTVERLEVEYSSSIEKALSGKVGAVARFKNLLIKALGGPEIEISGEISGSRKAIGQSKQKSTAEQTLQKLLATLTPLGEPAIFSELLKAAHFADTNQATVFLKIECEFNAPQFSFGGGVDAVNSEGYLILEKGGPGDHDYRDDYYRQLLDRPVTLSASILKMPNSSGGMSRAGHDAMLFRGFGGRNVPLGLFGSLTATPSYYQIKPYAIWRDAIWRG